MGRILVVDDDAELSDVVSMLLREAGHEAAVALSAAEALEAAKALRPDLVLADWNMPGGGARDLRERFEREGIACAVIVMTGMTDAPPATGFAGVLPKPFDADRLLELADAWCGGV